MIDLRRAPVVILAAGQSLRMGMPKPLLPIPRGPEKVWIEWQIERLGARTILVVLGAESESIAPHVTCAIAINHHWSYGPFASVQVGIQNLRDHSNGVWILPVDTPAPVAKTWEDLREPNVDAVIPTFDGQGGHPVWISEGLASQILKFDFKEPKSRLDFIFRDLNPNRKSYIPVSDPNVICNLNSPEEWNHYWSTRSY